MDIASPVCGQVFCVHFKLFCGCVEHLPTRLCRGADDRVAHPVRAARCERAHVMWAGIAVSCIDIDILNRHAERLGGELTTNRFDPLTQING